MWTLNCFLWLCYIFIVSPSNQVDVGYEAGALDDPSLELPAPSSELLPLFLEEPVDSYAIKNRPAVLYCRAAHALQVYFRCSGDEGRRASAQQLFVDPETGTRVAETAVNVSRNAVEEYFGGDRFQCRCVAWSSSGEVASRPAVVQNAFLQRQFLAVPHAERVEADTPAELRCLPPGGEPAPAVRWLRDGAPVSPDANVIVSSEGHLLIGQARLSDTANYTCVAENVAGKRQAKPVPLLVYANGGWSAWSEWSACPARGCEAQQSRFRTCDRPPPSHGAPCPGAPVQTRECADPDLCQLVDGSWSTWSEWSVCDIECKTYRARNCSDPAPSRGGRSCAGEGVQVRSCISPSCRVAKSKLPADLAMYTGFVVAVSVFTCVLLVIVFAMYYKRQQCNIHTTVVSDCYSAEERSRSQPDLTKTLVYVYSDSGRQYTLPLPRSDSLHHYDVPQLSPQSSERWIVGNNLEDFESLKMNHDSSHLSPFDQKYGFK